MSKHIRFASDEEYEPSGSEDEYDEREKQLLDKVRNKDEDPSDSEQEVFGVHSDTDSSIALSDVEGQEDDDDLPDERAWGKDKRHYYSTDYVDGDYGGFQGKDATLAEIEEEEARKLQKQLIEQLDDEDFSLDIFSKKTEVENKKQTEEVIKADISKLSKREKKDLLLKQSPEFFGLVEDFEGKMEIVKHLRPVIELSKQGKITNCEALDFVKLYHDAISNYSINIGMYLLLKANQVNIQSHPVIKRLYQFRQILNQMDPIFEEIVKPQVEMLLEKNKSVENTVKTAPKKILRLLKNMTNKRQEIKTTANETVVSKAESAEDSNEEEVDAKIQEINDKYEDDLDLNGQTEELDLDDPNANRRSITYQMAKNKGLTPHRKKEQRNPRVKHREKYRRAKIRRKGAVREVRKELSRYGGELSGIKTSVVKGIKIKT